MSTALPAHPPDPPGDPPADVYFARQPIVDRQHKLHGYELLFRSAAQLQGARIDDGAQASATVIKHAFVEFSGAGAIGPHANFINIDAELLGSDAIELLPPQAAVLELLETVQITPDVVARVRQLHAAGYRFALDDVVQLDAAYDSLLPYVSVVKVDLLATARSDWGPLCDRIHQRHLLALAEKVDSDEVARECLALGYDLFQGYFFARPALVTGRKLDPSRLSLLRLMRLILADADTAEIESVFKEEPGLSLSMLRLTNSAAAGLPVRVTSLRHAITFLGRRQLQRWMQLLMFAARDNQSGSGALLQLAATRGRMMELLAAECRNDDVAFSDQALMCGILSLTPALLQLPIGEIVASIGLEPALQDALVRRHGPLGALLELSLALEAASDDTRTSLTAIASARTAALGCGLQLPDVGRLQTLQAQALGWAFRVGMQAT